MPKPLLISEILEKTSKMKTQKEKVEYLQTHADNQILLNIFRMAWNDNIQFSLPEGAPPYNTSERPSSNLYNVNKHLGHFLANSKTPQLKKEVLFVRLLENMPEAEAKILLAVKDKKQPYKGITKTVVKKAFPSILT